ncbi:MAG: acyltransferase family protein [Weeksellaceae bacterium]|nr:acyltransferase family protein [Weeksellaceae bacterium]
MINYLSNLRVLAIFLVVLGHVAIPYLYELHVTSFTNWSIVNFISAVARLSVPVFVMITGALLLGRIEPLDLFLKKRLTRILRPFIFWTIAYIIFHFTWAGNEITTSEVVRKTVHAFFKEADYHFWFIYMILGLYLFMPILRLWIVNAKERDIRYFLFLWLITTFYNDYTKVYLPVVDLIYFSKYVGYLVLGYYIHKFIKPNTYTNWVGALMLFIGVLSTYLLTEIFSFRDGELNTVFLNLTLLNNALSSCGAFLLGMYFLNRSHKIVEKIDKNIFGIYFVHVMILKILSAYFFIDKFDYSPMMTIVYISVFTLVVFFLSFLIIHLLRKVPVLDKWVN